MNMWTTMNQELIELHQQEKAKELQRIYQTRDRLVELGYPSTVSRLRVATATWLLRLAARLDVCCAGRAAETPVASL